MNMHEIIEKLAGELPSWYEVHIEVERGSASVEWYDANGQNHLIDSADSTLEEQLLMALVDAKDHHESIQRER